MAQVAQGYGVKEKDYELSGMVTAGSYVIDVGLAPQKGPPPLGTNCGAEFACERCMSGKNPYWVEYPGHCGTLAPGDKCQYAEKCFKDEQSCLEYANSGPKYFKTGNSVPSCY